MSSMGYIILKLAGSHSLGDPRNLEDVFYLLVTRTHVVSLPLGLLVGGLCLIHYTLWILQFIRIQFLTGSDSSPISKI